MNKFYGCFVVFLLYNSVLGCSCAYTDTTLINNGSKQSESSFENTDSGYDPSKSSEVKKRSIWTTEFIVSLVTATVGLVVTIVSTVFATKLVKARNELKDPELKDPKNVQNEAQKIYNSKRNALRTEISSLIDELKEIGLNDVVDEKEYVLKSHALFNKRFRIHSEHPEDFLEEAREHVDGQLKVILADCFLGMGVGSIGVSMGGYLISKRVSAHKKGS
ncbi:MAG: hypothetical protein LBR15_06480 [Methanobrevibacter sp.]|jgi:hypothetical protein|nr:hypothetical protein [Candidatus Methanovirga australis]